jgi:hypothetical protein
MKANDLRMGNWIFIEDLEVQVECLPKHYNYEIVNPIPLTKYWLKRLGFEEGFYDTDMRIQVSTDCSMSIWTCDKTDNCLIGDNLTLTIKYVHQLQNLYFALTGVELDLSLNVA